MSQSEKTKHVLSVVERANLERQNTEDRIQKPECKNKANFGQNERKCLYRQGLERQARPRPLRKQSQFEKVKKAKVDEWMGDG